MDCTAVYTLTAIMDPKPATPPARRVTDLGGTRREIPGQRSQISCGRTPPSLVVFAMVGLGLTSFGPSPILPFLQPRTLRFLPRAEEEIEYSPDEHV